MPWRDHRPWSKLPRKKTNGDSTGLEKLLRPLSRALTVDLAGAIVRLTADPEIQARYDALADKRTEGSLTPPEQEELEFLFRANTLLGLLKAEAQSVLR